MTLSVTPILSIKSMISVAIVYSKDVPVAALNHHRDRHWCAHGHVTERVREEKPSRKVPGSSERRLRSQMVADFSAARSCHLARPVAGP
jgi:hypothetical protein